MSFIHSRKFSHFGTGIQVLRDNQFNPETMIRRAAEGEVSLVSADGEIEGERAPPSELARWSSHRVMQWLKEIDLAEYAPNLRGAGALRFVLF